MNPAQIDLPTVAGELALHARESVAVIDDEIVSGGFCQRDRDGISHRRERGNGSGGRSISLR